METFHLIGSLGFSVALGKRSGQRVEPAGSGAAVGRGSGAVGSVGDPAVPTAPRVTALWRGRSAVGHRLAAPVMETVKHLSTV